MFNIRVSILYCIICFILGVSSSQFNQYYKYLAAVETMNSSTTEIPTLNELDCGWECTNRDCQAFYFQPGNTSFGQCVFLIDYEYTNIPVQQNKSNGIFVKTPGSPWLSCPSTQDGVVNVKTSTLELTFRITLASVSHDDALSSCTAAGQTLMKIETVEKQASVQHILSSCPDFSSYDYWVDGYMETNVGWRYADGSSVPMDNIHLWASDAPNNNNGGIGSCVRLDPVYGFRWNDKVCTVDDCAYICETV